MKRLLALAVVGFAVGCDSFDECDSDWGSHHHRHHHKSDPVCAPAPPVCAPAPPICVPAPQAWLGVSMQDLNCELARRFGYPSECGVFIDYALPGGPAAGTLRGADILTDIDGIRIGNMKQFERTLRGLAPGHVAALNIFRDGRCQTVSVTLGEMPLEYRAHPSRRIYYTNPVCRD